MRGINWVLIKPGGPIKCLIVPLFFLHVHSIFCEFYSFTSDAKVQPMMMMMMDLLTK